MDGAVRLLKGHPSIRIVSEEVRIKLPEGRLPMRRRARLPNPKAGAHKVRPGSPACGLEREPTPDPAGAGLNTHRLTLAAGREAEGR